jgi:hypothetical protein
LRQGGDSDEALGCDRYSSDGNRNNGTSSECRCLEAKKRR